jgi:RNA polymerase sigma-70 factor, ECF subfamily
MVTERPFPRVKAIEVAMAVDVVQIEAWFKTYGPMVLRRCRQLLGSEEIAVEAMQDVFVNVLSRAETLRNDSPASLLYRVATHVCLNQIRYKRSRPEDSGGDLAERIALAPDPEETFMTRHFLTQVFATDCASSRVLTVLHLVDGMTLEQVAAEVGLSVSGVRNRLRRLKKHVKELENV